MVVKYMKELTGICIPSQSIRSLSCRRVNRQDFFMTRSRNHRVYVELIYDVLGFIPPSCIHPSLVQINNI